VAKEFEEIKRGGEKTQWDADAPGNALPAVDPVGLRGSGVGHEADSG
jgi:hypothetical protein